MTIPPSFEVRLAAYGLPGALDADRRKIWAFLDPEFDDFMRDHIARVIEYAPIYADNFRKNGSVFLKTYREYTAKLFLQPFDEHWVKDAEARAKFEMDHGIDMRSRAVISRSILTAACAIIARRYRFSGRKVAHLCDVAMRVLLLDVGNAIASHTNLGISDAKARSDELAAAVEGFGQAVNGVRAAVIDAIKSLQQTSHRLSSCADAAAAQARAASAAADETATGIDDTAAATQGLIGAIANIRSLTAKSAEMAHHSLAHAESTSATMRSLSQTVGRIGSIDGVRDFIQLK